MQAGSPTGEVLTGVRRAAACYSIPIENFSARLAERTFPGFKISDEMEAVFEPGAGILAVEDCVRTYAQLACQRGARLLLGAAVESWASEDGVTRITMTSGETHEAAALVLTPGAWASSLVGAGLAKVPVEVRRKVLLWNPVGAGCYSIDAGGVTFLFECPDGVFYGFPSMDGRTLKCGEHSRGELVIDPLLVDRSLRESDIAPVASFLGRHLTHVGLRPMRHAVCLYSMSPDGNFLVDRHPGHRNVFFGAGFSGHGFKFTSAIGEALADLATMGSTDAPIGFLSLRRFASR